VSGERVSSHDLTDALEHRLLAAGLHTSVLAHSLRVHAFARAESDAEEFQIDERALVIACLFHDAGSIPAASSDRFEVVGADLARDVALGEGLSPRASQEVWDAVALHTSPGIADRQRPLSRCVRRGVLTDFGNARLRRRHQKLVVEVEERWPRAEIELVLQGLVVDAAKEDPRRGAAPSWSADLVRGSVGLPPRQINPYF